MADKDTQSSSRYQATHLQKRLKQEMVCFARNPTPGILWYPPETNLNMLKYATAAIVGPENTSWAGGVFFLSFYYSDDYPRLPPRVTFETQVFHPNISASGTIYGHLGQSMGPASDK